MFGDEAIPLYDNEARAAVTELAGPGWKRSSSTSSTATATPARGPDPEIAGELAPEIPVFLSSDLYPMRRDFPRLNSTLVEAYAAAPSRDQLRKVRDATRESERSSTCG